MICKYCNDTGYIVDDIEIPPPGSRGSIILPSKHECICRFNETVHSRHKILEGVPDIVKSDTNQLKKCFNRFQIFVGTPIKFLLLAKTAIYSIDRSKKSASRVSIFQSLNFHQTYTMPAADDRDSLHIDDSNNIDYLFLMFTSKRKSPAFAETFAEAIANRVLLNKFTWVYSHEPNITNCLEYSDSLSESLKQFKTIDMSGLVFKNYTGAVDTELKRRQSANEQAANI